MNKNVRKILFLLTIGMCLLFVGEAKAASLAQFTLDKGDVIYNPYDIANNYSLENRAAYFPKKIAVYGGNSYVAFCVDDRTIQAEDGVTYTKNNSLSGYTKGIRAGIAEIIIRGCFGGNINGTNVCDGNTDEEKNNMYIVQIAIWDYLSSKGINQTSVTNAMNKLQDFYSADKISGLVNAAKSVESSYSTVNADVTLNASKLTFTYNGSNYVSNTVTVSGSTSGIAESLTVTPSVSGATVVTNGNSFYVKIPPTNLVPGTDYNVTVSVTGSATKTIYLASIYQYGSTQKLTAVAFDLETATSSDNEKIKGTLRIEPGKLRIVKKDSVTGELINGAKFKIYTDEACTQELKYVDGTTIGEITVNGETIVENLKGGHYYLKEISAPDNYYFVKRQTTNSNGGTPIVINNGLTNTITMQNAPSGEIVIQKKDSVTNQALQGAQFELYKCDSNGANCSLVTKDKDGNTIVKSLSSNGKTYSVLCTTNACSSSGTNASGQIIINKLDYGVYKVKEVVTPTVGNQGYKLIDNLTQIELKSSSTCSNYRPNAITNKEGIACAETLINNEPINIKLVKLGLDRNGKIPSSPVKLKNVTFKITAEEITDIWDDVMIINDDGLVIGIKPGTYTIKEVISPDKYAPTFTQVKIKVNQNGTVTVLDNNDMVKAYESGKITGLGVAANMPELDFYNRPSNLKVSKQDIANGEELPGARLEIKCEDGYSDSWISEKEPKEFYIEPNVTCTLKETVAPDGYEIELNELEFQIDGNGNVKAIKDLKSDSNYKLEANQITIYNGLKVPNTGRVMSIVALLLGIGLIGVGTYIVIKKTKEEQIK